MHLRANEPLPRVSWAGSSWRFRRWASRYPCSLGYLKRPCQSERCSSTAARLPCPRQCRRATRHTEASLGVNGADDSSTTDGECQLPDGTDPPTPARSVPAPAPRSGHRSPLRREVLDIVGTFVLVGE